MLSSTLPLVLNPVMDCGRREMLELRTKPINFRTSAFPNSLLLQHGLDYM
jgi:hypothetical protein